MPIVIKKTQEHVKKTKDLMIKSKVESSKNIYLVELLVLLPPYDVFCLILEL